MKSSFFIVCLLFVAKDVFPLGVSQPYLFRLAALLFPFVIAFVYFASGFSARALKNYWLIWLYSLLVLISVLFSTDYLFVGMQAFSFVVFLFYFVAFHEYCKGNVKILSQSTYAIIFLYVLMCAASVAMIKLDPANAYEFEFWSGYKRFNGVLPKSGMLGTISGLVLGLIIFSRLKKHWKLVLIIAPAVCLGLTLSRTFWLAFCVGIFLTSVLYYPRFKSVYYVLAFLSILVVSAIYTFNINISKSSEQVSTVVRADSLSNLSGRFQIWEKALEYIKEKPLVGFGFTQGGAVLLDGWRSPSNLGEGVQVARIIGRTTLHSGYLQAFMDLGIVGFIVYTIIIIYVPIVLAKYDKSRSYPQLFFILIFCTVANISESVIYSAANLPSLIYWWAAIFGLSRYFLPLAKRQRS